MSPCRCVSAMGGKRNQKIQVPSAFDTNVGYQFWGFLLQFVLELHWQQTHTHTH